MVSKSWMTRTTDLSCRITALLVIDFLVSWEVYVAGFCLLLLTWPAEPEQPRQQGDKNNNNEYMYVSKTDPSLYPFYATLIGGPILGLTGILRAMLSGTPTSLYAGAVSTVLGTSYFTCAGHVVYVSSQAILNAANDPYSAEFDTVCLSLLLMFVGVTAEALCWLSVTTLTVTRYKKCQTEESNDIDDIERRLYSDHEEQKMIYSLPFSRDRMRKLSAIFVMLSATGWLMLVSHMTLNGRDEIYEVGTYYVGPLLFLIALLHVAGCSEKMGVLTCILGMAYVMLVGAGLISYGEAIRLVHQYRSSTLNNDYWTMLTGGVVSLTSWTCALVLCQFYHAAALLRPTQAQGGVKGVHEVHVRERYAILWRNGTRGESHSGRPILFTNHCKETQDVHCMHTSSSLRVDILVSLR